MRFKNPLRYANPAGTKVYAAASIIEESHAHIVKMTMEQHRQIRASYATNQKFIETGVCHPKRDFNAEGQAHLDERNRHIGLKCELVNSYENQGMKNAIGEQFQCVNTSALPVISTAYL